MKKIEKLISVPPFIRHLRVDILKLITKKKKKKNHKFLDKSIYFWLAFETYCFHGHA